MRKHFLLLFLMALLPLAGFAANPVVGFSADSESATYNGTTANLPTPTKINEQNITTDLLNLKWFYVDGTAETEITKNADGKYKYTNAGTYKVTFDLNEELGTGTTHYTANWVVKQKEVTVSAKLKAGQSVIYGDEFNKLKFEALYDGFIASDLSNGNPKSEVMSGAVTDFITNYVKGSAVANYTIRPIITTLTSKNYTFKVKEIDNTFSVLAKSIVDNSSKFTFSFSELVYKAEGQVPTITVKDLALDQNATFAAKFYTNEACTENEYTPAVYYTKSELQAVVDAVEALESSEMIGENNSKAINAVLSSSYTATTEKSVVINFNSFKTTVNALPTETTEFEKTPATGDISKFKDADTYYVKIQGSENYGGNAIKKSFKIKQKALAITTLNQNKTYTGVVLTMDNTKITYEGLEEADKATDEENPSVKVNKPAETNVFAETGISIKVKTAKPVTFVGTGSDYKLQAYAVKTTGTDPNTVETPINDVTKIFKNYYVAYFYDGVLTVDPAELTFTLKDQEVQYGTESNLKPGVSYTPTTTDYTDYLTVTGFVAGDAVVTYPTLKVAATETTANSSLYQITTDFTNVALKHTDDDDNVTVVPFNNYKLKNTSKTISILSLIKGNINVRPIDASIIYGAPQAQLTVNVSTANEDDAAAAAEILKKAVVIAETANDATTKYPNVGVYKMTLDLNKLADDADYKALIKNYNIAPFTGEYTISKRDLTKITIANQTVAKHDNANDALADLDEDLVVFEADAADKFELSDYDKAILKEQFEYVFKDGVSTANKTTSPIADAIRIKFVDGVTAFKNFNLPSGVTLGVNGNRVANKYILGALTVAETAGNAIVLKPVNKATWTAADEATRKGYGYNAINSANGQIATVKFGNFAMEAERWYTMVLPFNTTVADLSQTLGYAVVNVLNKENATDDVKFKLYMQEIPANEPFLVKVYKNINLGDQDMNGTEDDPVTFTAKNIVFAETPSVEDKAGNKFIGTFMGYQTANDVDDEYYMATSNSGWYQHGYTRPSGAYLKVVAAQSARIFVEEPDGSTTAIELINGEAVPAAEGWYTLNGVKLQGVPTEKGVYINNGKKVVIK